MLHLGARRYICLITQVDYPTRGLQNLSWNKLYISTAEVLSAYLLVGIFECIGAVYVYVYVWCRLLQPSLKILFKRKSKMKNSVLNWTPVEILRLSCRGLIIILCWLWNEEEQEKKKKTIIVITPSNFKFTIGLCLMQRAWSEDPVPHLMISFLSVIIPVLWFEGELRKGLFMKW